jgi:hypothetical protein
MAELPGTLSDHGDGVATELARNFQAALSGTAEPVREQLETIERTIAERERELAELRKLRTAGHRLLAIIDPDSKPKPAPKRDRSGRGDRPRVSAAKVDALADWLRANYSSDEGFTVPELTRREDFDLMSRATTDNAVRQLAEDGRLRLDHVDGNARVFKLVG